MARALSRVSRAAWYPCSTVRSLPSLPAKAIAPSLNGPVPLRKSKSPARTAGTYVATGFGAGGRVIFSSANLASNDISDDGHAGQARIVHECRSETQETEARRGFSQARVMQAYSLQYVEETEREKPRRARGSCVVVGVHGESGLKRWISSTSYPSGASMKMKRLPEDVVVGPSVILIPLACKVRMVSSRFST